MPSVTIAEFTAPRFRATLAAVASAALLFAAIYACDDLMRATAAAGAGAEEITQSGDLVRLVSLMVSLLAACWAYGSVYRWQSRTRRQDNTSQPEPHDAIPAGSANALLVTDNDARIVWSNHAFSNLTGYSLEEALGRHCSSLLKAGPHDREFYDGLWRTLSAGLSWHGEIINRRKDGSLFHDELTITPLPGSDRSLGHTVAPQHDCDTLRQTPPVYFSLPNRNLILEHLAQMLDSCAHSGHHVALMLLALEHFDHPGKHADHNDCDRFPAEMARRMAACLPTGDTTIRYGNNEFAVILELGSDEDEAYLEAMMIAGNILATVTTTAQPPIDQTDAADMATRHCGSCCIGITVSDQPATSAEELLKRAVAAMYQARTVGHNSIRFYRRTAHSSASAH